MSRSVEWLPIGHITHGYRRVFTIRENGALRHVVQFVPMPYERVFQVKEMGGADVPDASLWWGLSMIVELVSRGVLLGLKNPDYADDGYLQVRPEQLPVDQMISLSALNQAFSEGIFELPDRTEVD